jgi:hypothetical protein
MNLRLDEKGVPPVKIGPGAGVSEGPVGPLAVLGFDDRGDGGGKHRGRRHEKGDIDLYGEDERGRFPADGAGQGGKGWFLPHPPAIVVKGKDIPVPGRGQVKLPVPGGLPGGEENLQAGVLPEPPAAAGEGGGPGDGQGLELSPEFKAQGQAPAPAGQTAGNLEAAGGRGPRKGRQAEAAGGHVRSRMMA